MNENQPTVTQGRLIATGLRFAVIVSRFNDFITKQLLEGCLDTLRRHGADNQLIEIFWVPGSFEIPITAKEVALTGKFDAIICLGAIIRGATSHYDHVAGHTSGGIAQVGLETGIPTIFGVITTESIEQAIERAGTKAGNKGNDAAIAAIEMVNLFTDLRRRHENAAKIAKA
jgi:6,7-dimethyl-8-ribityllumazine synthase